MKIVQQGGWKNIEVDGMLNFHFFEQQQRIPIHIQLQPFPILVFWTMALSKPAATTKNVQIFLTFVSLIFSIVSVATVFWVSTETNDTGLFSYKVGDEIKELTCDSMMSQTQCGYLQSSQNSSIISICFSFLSFSWLLHQYAFSSPMNALVSLSLAFLQFCFSITTTVVFKYFKSDYLNADDGINVEYPVDTYAHYKFGYYLWISATSLSFLVAAISCVSLYQQTRGDTGSAKITRDIEGH